MLWWCRQILWSVAVFWSSWCMILPALVVTVLTKVCFQKVHTLMDISVCQELACWWLKTCQFCVYHPCSHIAVMIVILCNLIKHSWSNRLKDWKSFPQEKISSMTSGSDISNHYLANPNIQENPRLLWNRILGHLACCHKHKHWSWVKLMPLTVCCSRLLASTFTITYRDILMIIW